MESVSVRFRFVVADFEARRLHGGAVTFKMQRIGRRCWSLLRHDLPRPIRLRRPDTLRQVQRRMGPRRRDGMPRRGADRARSRYPRA